MTAMCRLTIVALLVCLVPLVSGQRPVQPKPPPIAYLPANKSVYQHFSAAAETMLQEDVLGVWYLRAVDLVHGGFNADFARDWSPMPSHGKFSVFQGRMTWVATQVVLHRPTQRAQFLQYVRHGVDYLRNTLWDKRAGGSFWGLAYDGPISSTFTDSKQLYGVSRGSWQDDSWKGLWDDKSAVPCTQLCAHALQA